MNILQEMMHFGRKIGKILKENAFFQKNARFSSKKYELLSDRSLVGIQSGTPQGGQFDRLFLYSVQIMLCNNSFSIMPE